MRRLTLFAALALTGCASFSLAPMTAKMKALHGQPVQEAFTELGYPDRHDTVAGMTVYYWGTDQSGCSIKVVATPEGRVADATGYGSPAACARYR